MLKRIRKHYHTSFGGEVPKAMDVAIGRVVAVVSDTASTTRRDAKRKGMTPKGPSMEVTNSTRRLYEQRR